MKKVLRLLLIAIMVLPFSNTIVNNKSLNFEAAVCSTLEECNAMQEEIEADKETAEKELADLQEEEAVLDSKLKLIKKKMTTTEKSITVAEEKITLLEDEIKQLEKDIEEKEGIILERIAQQQKQENKNVYLTLLMSSKNLSDISRRIKIIDTFNADDKELVDELEVDKEKNEENKVELETEKEELEAYKVELEEQETEAIEIRKEVQKQVSAKFAAIDSLSSTEADIDAQLAIINRPEGGGNVTPGAWGRPTAGGIVTTQYNSPTYTWLYGRTHPAVDIAWWGSIDSIGDGVVLVAEYNGTFGYNVAIKHGDYISFYAHLSYLSVYAGQNVSRGQSLGMAGNTGLSDGIHLHLETYYKMPYFNYDKGMRTAYSMDPLDLIGHNVYPYSSDSW